MMERTKIGGGDESVDDFHLKGLLDEIDETIAESVPRRMTLIGMTASGPGIKCETIEVHKRGGIEHI